MVSTWEARQSGRPGGKIQCKIHGGRSMPDAILYITRKPDNSEGPLPGSTDMEAGLCRRPYGVYMGSPTEREPR